MDNVNIEDLKIYDKHQKFYTANNNFDFVDANILNKLVTAGNSKATVLIIVDHDIVDLKTAENVLLLKILQAVNLLIENVLIVSKPALPLNVFLRILEVDKCLIFGIKPKNMGLHINISNYQPVSFNNKILLFSDAVDDLQKHPEKKKLLWNALQNIFK